MIQIQLQRVDSTAYCRTSMSFTYRCTIAFFTNKKKDGQNKANSPLLNLILIFLTWTNMQKQKAAGPEPSEGDSVGKDKKRNETENWEFGWKERFLNQNLGKVRI